MLYEPQVYSVEPQKSSNANFFEYKKQTAKHPPILKTLIEKGNQNLYSTTTYHTIIIVLQETGLAKILTKYTIILASRRIVIEREIRFMIVENKLDLMFLIVCYVGLLCIKRVISSMQPFLQTAALTIEYQSLISVSFTNRLQLRFDLSSVRVNPIC